MRNIPRIEFVIFALHVYMVFIGATVILWIT